MMSILFEYSAMFFSIVKFQNIVSSSPLKQIIQIDANKKQWIKDAFVKISSLLNIF